MIFYLQMVSIRKGLKYRRLMENRNHLPNIQNRSSNVMKNVNRQPAWVDNFNICPKNPFKFLSLHSWSQAVVNSVQAAQESTNLSKIGLFVKVFV